MPVTPDFKTRLADIAHRNRKKEHQPGYKWPTEKWVECVSQYLVVGNMRQVAALTGVSYDVLNKWKATLRWKEIEQEVRASQIINLDTKLGKIVEKSLDAVLDRVENGDFIYDQKSGEVRRRPAALRDVHRVAVDAIAKQSDVRTGLEQRGDTGKTSVEEHLKMLAGEMAKWFEKDAKKNEVIDLVEVEDAVYSERSELQEVSEDGSDVSESLAQPESEMVSSNDLSGLRGSNDKGPSAE